MNASEVVIYILYLTYECSRCLIDGVTFIYESNRPTNNRDLMPPKNRYKIVFVVHWFIYYILMHTYLLFN